MVTKKESDKSKILQRRITVANLREHGAKVWVKASSRQEDEALAELLRNGEEEAEAIRLNTQKKYEAISLKRQEEREAKKLKGQEEVKSDEIKPPLKEWQVIRLMRQEEAKANELMRQKKYEAIRLKQQEEIKTNELMQQQEPEDKARAEELRRLKEAIAGKEWQDKLLKKLVISTEIEARKIGQLLDLCCELIPAPIAKKIIADCRTLSFIKAKELPKGWLLTYQTLSDIFLSSFYWILKNDVYGIYLCTQKFKDYTLHTIPTLIRIPESIASDYSLNLHTDYSIEDYNNDINKHKKCNRYTAALVETIYFLLTNSEIKRSIIQSDSPFRNLHSVVELLIDMGAIDSALRLYKIDERICNTPIKLSLLANKSVQSGNLDDSIKLVGKLIEQEPYHPSIPAIQAEIKRLEQRHRLKATFSIDFTKVDELSGVEFENLLMDKFIAMGFKAESTPNTGDFGADLIVENNEGTRIIVQCKRFKSKVNLKAVQEVVGAMGHYAGDMGIVITNNSFLNSAVKLAESHDIELWDGDKLVSFLAGDLSFSQVFS